MLNGHDTARAADALPYVPNDLPGDDWLRVSMGAKSAGVDFETWHSWCQGASNYKGEADCRARWKSIDPNGPVQAGTLFQFAKENGWHSDNGKATARPAPERTTRPAEPTKKPAPGHSAADVWSRCEPVKAHPYATRKQFADCVLTLLRVVPANDRLTIAGQCVAGFLAVPGFAPDGKLQTIQFVPGEGKKLNLPGSTVAGASLTIGPTDGPAVVVEGLATASAVFSSTGGRAVACFGSGNMRRVIEAMRQREPETQITIAPDRGKEAEARELATAFNCAVACLPECEPSNFDLNDIFIRDGFDAVQALLETATMPPVTYPLSVAFADELGDKYEPPDELIEGVLTVDGGSVLYGDSNSGKTFLAIDMAASVARGVPWQGKRTEAGLVVYLAVESPASVRTRLQAYQKHHACTVPNFAIVQSPIDLFADDADANRVITLVQILERQRGQKVRLIVGDTLARLSAGANENAGQDMGLVVRRFDRIRTDCKAHFLLVHHCGKNAANGARGWSGIRAAIDSELEVTDAPAGRCLEITKQRDLPSKGDRIGFRLDVVHMGETKWGTPATSCVVTTADAPAKQTGKRMSECDGAVLEFLVGHKIGIKKRDVVTHFEGRYEKGPIYRAMKGLVTAGAVHEAAGMVCAAGVAK